MEDVLMKMILLMLVLISAPAMSMDASKIDETVSLLGHESFDVRELATENLSKLPGGCIKSLMILCKHYNDIGELEIAGRLHRVIKNVFDNDVLTRDDRYLRIHAWTGLYMHLVSNPNGTHAVWLVDSVSAESPCDGKIGRRDLIEKVNDLSIVNFSRENLRNYGGLFKAGTEYQLTIRKAKDIDKLDERGIDIGTDDDYGPPQVVTIKVGRLDDFYVNKEVLELLREVAWREFLDDVRTGLR